MVYYFNKINYIKYNQNICNTIAVEYSITLIIKFYYFILLLVYILKITIVLIKLLYLLVNFLDGKLIYL